MSVQFVFSTMDNRLCRHNAAVLNHAPNCLVINQVVSSDRAADPAGRDREVTRAPGLRVLDCYERGLSRSRNRGIQHASADICYLCDDDVDLVEGAERRVAGAFARHVKADVLVFSPSPGGAKGLLGKGVRALLPLRVRCMGVRSIEIAFRRAAVQTRGICFDERFGLGATFPSGEEAIFLADCIDAGLKLGWVDEAIASHPFHSSGVDYRNPALPEAKGAIMARIFGANCPWYFVPFALKSYPFYRRCIGILPFLRALARGAERYAELCRRPPVEPLRAD